MVRSGPSRTDGQRMQDKFIHDILICGQYVRTDCTADVLDNVCAGHYVRRALNKTCNKQKKRILVAMVAGAKSDCLSNKKQALVAIIASTIQRTGIQDYKATAPNLLN